MLARPELPLPLLLQLVLLLHLLLRSDICQSSCTHMGTGGGQWRVGTLNAARHGFLQFLQMRSQRGEPSKHSSLRLLNRGINDARDVHGNIPDNACAGCKLVNASTACCHVCSCW